MEKLSKHQFAADLGGKNVSSTVSRLSYASRWRGEAKSLARLFLAGPENGRSYPFWVIQ